MSPGEPPAFELEPAAVNLILDSIPNNVSALPTVAASQPVHGQAVPGGFASVLASAKALSTPSSGGTDGVPGTPVEEGGGTGPTPNVKTPALGNLAGKKLTGNFAVTPAAATGANPVTHAFVPTTPGAIPALPVPASLFPLSLPQPDLLLSNLSQASLSQASLLPSSALQPRLPATPTPTQEAIQSLAVQNSRVQNSGVSLGGQTLGIESPAGRNAAPQAEVSASDSLGRSGSDFYSAPQQTVFRPAPAAPILGTFDAQESLAGKSATGADFSPQETLNANPRSISAGEPSASASNGIQALPSAAAEVRATAPLPAPASAREEPGAGAVTANLTGENQGNAILANAALTDPFSAQALANAPLTSVSSANLSETVEALANGSLAKASLGDESPRAVGEPTIQDAAKEIGASETETEPMLLASAMPAAGPAEAARVFSSNLASLQPSASLPPAPPAAGREPAAPDLPASTQAATGDLARQTESANLLAGIIEPALAESLAEPVVASAGENPAAESGKFLPRGVTPKIAETVTGASAGPVSGSAGTRAASLTAPGLAAGADSEAGSLTAGATPFSVFFSGVGPGTEAAAATLPKMILPTTSFAFRDSHISGAAPGAAAQAAGTTGGSGIPESSSPQNAKDSLAGSANPSPSAGATLGLTSAQSSGQTVGQPLHRDADLSVAAWPAGATTEATGISAALSGQTGLGGESQPKPETLPSTAAGSPANLPPAAPPALPAAVPGPVQMAQMVSRAEQSEMRIGMNTSAFGSVEVRTVVHASDVGLTVGSEKGDLRGLLANDMPSIANTLEQQNLRLSSVNFMQGFGSPNHSAGGGDSQQRSFLPPRAVPVSGLAKSAEEDSTTPLNPWESSGGGTGLSILA
jgi:hypothetical protein